MTIDKETTNPSERDEFLREARTPQPGILREVVSFLRHSRKVWLAPIIIGLLIIGVVVVLGGTPLAPFIYTLF